MAVVSVPGLARAFLLAFVASCTSKPATETGSPATRRESLARVVVPGGPVLAAPLLSDTPASFSTAFFRPYEHIEGSEEKDPCVFWMHGTFGSAPVRAMLTANGRSLRVELSSIMDARKIAYEGVLKTSPCQGEVEDDAGVLGSDGPAGELAGLPGVLAISLAHSPRSLRSRGLPRTRLEGRAIAGHAMPTLDLRSVLYWQVEAYIALEAALIEHTGAVLDIADALDDRHQNFIVAYWTTDRQLWLAELAGERPAVRNAVATGLFCTTQSCTANLVGAEPRPGFPFVIADIQRWTCGTNCTCNREAQLWTVTPRGFTLSGRVQTATHPDGFVDVNENVATSLQWVSVDDRLPVDLLLQRHVTSGWPPESRIEEIIVFAFDPRRERYARDPRPIEMSPAVRATLRMCAEFDTL